MPSKLPTYLQRLSASRPAPTHRDDGHRPSAAAQGYGHRWRKLRLLILREQPICASCQHAAATEVDHIKAKAKGGGDERENLIGYCKPCHSAKTYREDGALRTNKRHIISKK